VIGPDFTLVEERPLPISTDFAAAVPRDDGAGYVVSMWLPGAQDPKPFHVVQDGGLLR